MSKATSLVLQHVMQIGYPYNATTPYAGRLQELSATRLLN